MSPEFKKINYFFICQNDEREGRKGKKLKSVFFSESNCTIISRQKCKKIFRMLTRLRCLKWEQLKANFSFYKTVLLFEVTK